MTLPVERLLAGVLAGDRAMVGQAITLVESTQASDQKVAQELLAELLPHAGQAHRVGITGVPGVGKSTFIEALGTQLTSQGHRVAVLAVDPTSTVTGGSILGDKTRMQKLANDPAAFVRPSPSAGTLGGVTRRTRETMVVLEAAGYDVVLVETVGVGQSETVVAAMVDIFVVLMLPGAGDELQGIKKGVLELADLIAVNKADGDHLPEARTAARDYTAALRLTQPLSTAWRPQVSMVSSLTGDGIEELWSSVLAHREALESAGQWEEKRRNQRLAWMWAMVEDRLLVALRNDSTVLEVLKDVETQVQDGTMHPSAAAEALDQAFGQA
ncbi:MAG: methylmalonyl Co-A mutase-associated GTPase MeaB [Actinobacteria bacterium]|jgi:LAO/AO transport system kinase|nr:methylmalonyl Co-A mutase-associated GTPase MeaB [Actinomycetota bacterium]MBT3745590.1 methylmalonyl Co-A mutase-associated GTPase MeaB [Actinomycetota bacterium]MBT3969683.1 methylmalonyl Co-A mutase-associated GTPase MeaB [Actinomycetota bacterium]MBT4010289.1 methylmalonyl Co-A mutase-associated GTPase MeaB [Actinomycetota bacterium]MBT4303010.1 methylmalonyl Co-A mutase-associated GTPase MeaB [Actinomycetota bacterium]